MIRGILADSAKVFNFQEAYGLDQKEVRIHFSTTGMDCCVVLRMR